MKIKFFLPMVKFTYKDIGFNIKKKIIYIEDYLSPSTGVHTSVYISGLAISKLGYNEKISCPL